MQSSWLTETVELLWDGSDSQIEAALEIERNVLRVRGRVPTFDSDISQVSFEGYPVLLDSLRFLGIDELLCGVNGLGSAKNGHFQAEGYAVSDLNQSDLRPPRLEEDSLVCALFGHVMGSEQPLRQLERAQVRDMDDEGMGSLKLNEASTDL